MFNILIHQIFFVIRTGFEPITVRNLLFQLIVLLSPSQLCLWLASPHSVYQFRHLTILPHFTRLTDWLPCGSGGFPLFRDSVVRGGIEPPARRFSVYCSTYWAITPNLRLRSPLCCANSITFKIRPTISFLSHRNNTILLIMLGYPSRPNLNCFLSFNEASAKGDEFWFHSGLSTSVEWRKPLSISFCLGE